jgi:hypothetical protein
MGGADPHRRLTVKGASGNPIWYLREATGAFRLYPSEASVLNGM